MHLGVVRLQLIEVEASRVARVLECDRPLVVSRRAGKEGPLKCAHALNHYAIEFDWWSEGGG